MQHAATLVFTGKFHPDSFADFVRHRANRLSIEAHIAVNDTERLEVAVSGEEDLVDAFEMACSLGPIDCLVLDVNRRGEPRSATVTAHVVEDST